MKIDDITPYFMAEVPGCPDETARMAVERVFRDMCVRAKLWTEWIDPIPMIDDVATYDVDAPTNASLTESVIELWIGSHRLIGKTMDEIRYLVPDWETGRSNEPRYFNTPDTRQTVTVYPTPRGATMPLRVRGMFTPKRSITSIPDNVALFHQSLIEMGAKAVLMLQAKQQWSDPKMGAYWQQQFENKLEEARNNKEKGDVPASDRVIPRAFG